MELGHRWRAPRGLAPGWGKRAPRCGGARPGCRRSALRLLGADSPYQGPCDFLCRRAHVFSHGPPKPSRGRLSRSLAGEAERSLPAGHGAPTALSVRLSGTVNAILAALATISRFAAPSFWR